MWLIVVIAIICVIVAVSVCRRKAIEGPQPPEYPGAWPLIGHGHLLARGNSVALVDLMRDMVNFATSCGGVMSVRPGPRTVYAVTDPDDCVTLANAALDKEYFYDFLKPVLGEGLLTGEVSIWKIHRKLLIPAFSQGVLEGFIGVFNSQAKRLVSRLDQESGKNPFDFWTYIGPSALGTICLTAMGGAKADDFLSDDYMHAVEETFSLFTQRVQKFWLHNNFIYYFSSIRNNMLQCAKVINELSYAVLQRKKCGSRKDNMTNVNAGMRFKKFMDLIIEYSGENGLLTDQEIREEVNTIIMAGHDTTASTIVYIIILLGSYPDVQERVYNEISGVLGERDVEKQDLTKLVFLEAVIKEAMRLYPIGPIIARKLSQSVKLKNYTLPTGSAVGLVLYALNRHKMWGADADLFDPSRWLDRSRIPEHQAAFASFSLGRRMCIGKNYALMHMKTTLAHLVRNFRFKSNISKLRLKWDMMLKPHSGHLISVERRT